MDNLKRTALLLLLIAPPAMAGGNYATCLLDKLPGVANDVAANAIVQTCSSKFPGGFQTVGLGSGRGDWFGFKSGAECTAKKAADTRSDRAAHMIGAACRRLYDELDLTYEPMTGNKKVLTPYDGPVVPLEPRRPNYFDQFDR